MKKITLALVLIIVLTIPSFAAASWGKLSLFGKIATTQNDVEGIDLGIETETGVNTGYQLAFIALSDDITGTQGGLIAYAKKIKGSQGGFIALSEDTQGFQGGLITYSQNLVGVQYGFLNIAMNSKGFQLGFVNYSEYMEKGLQIGILNIIKNSTLPVMVIANVKF